MNNLINEVRKNIKEVYLNDNLPILVEFNGSKESLFVIQLVIDTFTEMKKSDVKLNKPVHIISYDTLLNIPSNQINNEKIMENVKEVVSANQLPVICHVIRPTVMNGYWANVIGRGFPSPNNAYKWCTDKLKMGPLNEFLDKVIEKHKEYIILAGIQNKEEQIKESTTSKVKVNDIKNAYIFAPFNNLTSKDAENFIENNQSELKVNKEIVSQLTLTNISYLLMNQESKRSTICDKSGFNCWLCTISPTEDILSPFIKKGDEWLKPLNEFRSWLLSIRDNDSYRMRKRQNETIYFSKVDFKDNKIIIPNKATREFIIIEEKVEGWIDNNSRMWKVFDSVNAEEEAKRYIISKNINLEDGTNPCILVRKSEKDFAQLGLGPFTQKAREEILKKLLMLQKELENKYVVIREAELNAIKKIWFGFGVWNDTVSEIFYEVFNKELTTISDDVILFSNADLRILDEICKEKGVKIDTLKEIFSVQKTHMGYENRVDAYRSLQKILSQEELHIQIGGEEDEN